MSATEYFSLCTVSNSSCFKITSSNLSAKIPNISAQGIWYKILPVSAKYYKEKIKQAKWTVNDKGYYSRKRGKKDPVGVMVFWQWPTPYNYQQEG